MFRKIILCILAVTFPWSTLPDATARAQVARTEHLTYEETVERLESVMDLVEELRSHIDRSQFDLEALLEKLDYDADKIVSFVRNKIAFEQYAGLLRGAEGTLISRAGNALDQSVLLAKLLRDAGYEARIARGELNETLARTLLQQMTSTPAPADAIGDVEAMEKLVQDSAESLGIDTTLLIEALQKSEVRETTYAKEALENQNFLLATLADAQISLGDPNGIRQLLDEAKDYFWVQYRTGPSRPWDNEHPVFRHPQSLDQVEVSEVFNVAIPAVLQHRFRFEVVMEQNVGGKTVSKNIVPPWDAPLANLVGKEFTYQTLSRHLLSQAQNGQMLSAPADRIDILLPSLNGRPTGSGFDLLGNAIDYDASASPFAPLFATLATQSAKAMSALSGLGTSTGSNDSNRVRLQSLKLKLSLLKPDGTEVVHWRSLYEFEPDILKDLDQWDNRYRDLTQVVHLGFVVGSSNNAHTFDLALRTLVQNRNNLKYLPWMLRGEKLSDLDPASFAGSRPASVRWVGHDLMPAVFDARPIGDPDVIIYRSAPTLLLHSQTAPIAGEALESMDIVQNPQRAIDVEELAVDARAVLFAGVWDTVTEGTLIHSPGASSISTRSLFERAKSSGVPVGVVSESTINTLADFDIPSAARARIREEVNQGFVIILPVASSSEHSDIHGWWRIDPRTGSALGMVTQGYRYGGMELTEDQITTLIIFGSVLVFVAGVLQVIACVPNESASAADCVCAGAGALIGAGAGLAALLKNPAPGVILGLFGAIVGLICAVGSLVDWEGRPDPEY